MTETLAPIAPLALNHVGVTVPDIFGAIEWYGAVFGFNCIMGPRLLQAEAVASHETGHIFGPRFRRAYQAHLLTANGAGLELFQFVDPPPSPLPRDAWSMSGLAPGACVSRIRTLTRWSPASCQRRDIFMPDPLRSSPGDRGGSPIASIRGPTRSKSCRTLTRKSFRTGLSRG
jgi:hypothetical protein